MRNKRSTLWKAYAPPGAKEATVFLIHRPMFAMTSISRQSLRRSGYFLVDGHAYVLGIVYPIRQGYSCYAISNVDIRISPFCHRQGSLWLTVRYYLHTGGLVQRYA